MKILAGTVVLATLLAASTMAGPLTWRTINLQDHGWIGITADSGATGFPIMMADIGVSFFAAGGKDGSAFITLADVDGYNTMFQAPAAFLGDLSRALNGTLKFDTRTSETPDYSGPVVALKGGGETLVYVVAQPATNDWTTVEVPIAPGEGWYVGQEGGARATAADFEKVLNDVSALWISAENHSGVSETTSLSNVELMAGVPEPATYLLSALGLAVIGLKARRRS